MSSKVTPETVTKKAPAPVDPKKVKVAHILDGKHVTIIMTTFTVYALFADDIRLAGTRKSADDVFFSLSCIALACFTSELLANIYSRTGYLWGFYFWLDFISTLSLIPDIGWIWEPIAGDGGGSGTAALKAGKASRASSKAGRVVRLVRLVRMVRIVKLYKMHKGDQDLDVSQLTIEPSKVGKKLTEVTTRRLIVLILTMVLILPLFDGALNSTYDTYQSTGLLGLHRLPQDYNLTGEVTEYHFRKSIGLWLNDAGPLLYLEICAPPVPPYTQGCSVSFSKETIARWVRDQRFQPVDSAGTVKSTSPYTERRNGVTDWSFSDYYLNEEDVDANYRTEERNANEATGCYLGDPEVGINNDRGPDGNMFCRSVAYFDNRATTTLEAGMNIAKTFGVMLLLAGGSIMFSKDSQALVIGPIERMMSMVKLLAANPLASTKRGGITLQEDEEVAKAGYETALLEATLEKVGSLLQVGFGAAGADIIGQNMGSGVFDPMVRGKRITSIYGFCDIRQFTDTTECLQEEVMVYVNKLGDIVHGCTHNYYGMANKNVGDAFLLSWKICNGELPGFSVFSDKPTDESRKRVNETHRCPPNPGAGRVQRLLTPTEMADSAFTAFLKTIVDLDNANSRDDGSLKVYASNARVLKRFGPGFKVKMGFGMHVGWAIEGAIGSRFKIDATYLSPHVEMADRLEAGSKIFGTPLNMSHWFVTLMSPEVLKYLRRMDRIKVAGCAEPMTVYTFDVLNMVPGVFAPQFDERGREQLQVKLTDPRFSELQVGLHPAFVSTFNAGTTAYLKGDWAEARRVLSTALELKPKDGPCITVLEYMNSIDGGVAPADWPGYRELDGY